MGLTQARQGCTIAGMNVSARFASFLTASQRDALDRVRAAMQTLEQKERKEEESRARRPVDLSRFAETQPET